MDKNNFGRTLAELRKSKKLSQYSLADMLGFSRGQIANYEQGQRQPDFDALKTLADFFNVSVDYLLGRTDSPHTPEYRNIRSEMIFRESNQGVFVQELEKVLKDSNVMFDGMQLDIEDKKDVITILKIIKRHKQKNWHNNQKQIEILDLLDKSDATITVGGRTLSVNEKIEILEFLKEKIIENTEQAPSDYETVISTSRQRKSTVETLSEADKEEIKNTIEFAKKQPKRKK